MADKIKIDFSITKGEERKNILKRLNFNNRIKFLAEKVETIEKYNEALNYGYEYFQGYYFSKRRILSSKAINTNKHIALKILEKINESEIDFDSIESLILKDVGLSYKLLKLINSATFFGQKQIIKWFYVVSILAA